MKVFRELDRTRKIFVVAAATFIFLQLFLTAAPILSRAVPVEPDDAYNLIVKAEQMRGGCFLQDCPALTTLRDQLFVPDPDPQLAFTRLRVYQRSFLVYNPLHSAVLSGLRSLGVGYELSFNLVAILGKLLICLGIVVWLRALFGKQTATLALILLAPAIFGGQGLESVWPSNMALGIALILWGLILRRSEWLKYIFLPLVLIMILLHPIGKIYSALALGLESVLGRRQNLVILWIAGVIVASSLAIPNLVEKPELEITTSYFFAEASSVTGAGNFLKDNPLPRMRFWANAYPSPLIALFLVFAGTVLFWREKRRQQEFGVMSLGLLGLMLLGWLYYFPGVGRVLLARVNVPLEILLTGIVGQAAFSAAAATIRKLRDPRKKDASRSQGSGYKIWQITFAGLSLSAFVLVFGHYFLYHGKHFVLTLNEMKNDANFSFNEEQIEKVAITSDEDLLPTVLYMNETPMYYYLSNGALEFGALYYKAYDAEELRDGEYTDQLESVSHVVLRNPLHGFNHKGQETGVLLENGDTLMLGGFPANTTNPYELLASSDSESSSCSVMITWRHSDGHQGTQSISCASDDWVALPDEAAGASSVQLSLNNTDSILLKGFRYSPHASTFWPWDTGLRIVVAGPNEASIGLLLQNSELSQGLPFRVSVIDDTGFSLLAKVDEH